MLLYIIEHPDKVLHPKEDPYRFARLRLRTEPAIDARLEVAGAR
jgi:hypothetical protein